MDYTITPLTPHGTGAEITGLQLGRPLDEAQRARLNQALATHHVLVIRDQRLSPAGFAAAAENFGTLMAQHIQGNASREHPLVFELKPVPVAPNVFKAAGEAFHTDHSFDQQPPKATALHPVVLPSSGGDTQFVNTHLAYDDLPDETKARIDGLRAVHQYYSRHARAKVRQLSEENLRALPPPAIHPLAPVHPDNGRRHLYINPSRMDSIIGMPDDEAMRLIERLMAHATRSTYEYRHVWRQGDMVIWDNRSVLHKANSDYEMKNGEGRHMYRLMLR